MEIHGKRAAVAGVFGIGLALGAIGAVVLTQHNPVPGGFLLTIGVLAVLLCGRRLLSRTPQLRATGAGLELTGTLVPWSAIKQIYVGNMSLPTNQLTRKVSPTIAIDFHRRRTLWKLPVHFWLQTPFSVGDVDIASMTMNANVAASQLEAMRVRSLPASDDIAIGDVADLPDARVHRD
jgi:hypothetical protein